MPKCLLAIKGYPATLNAQPYKQIYHFEVAICGGNSIVKKLLAHYYILKSSFKK
jgi:hypothetical protein